MARTVRKKKELSLEEKLAEALVPEKEWPYQVPENWCWVRLDAIADIIMGQSPSGDSTTDDSKFIPLIGGAADMGLLYPDVSRYTKKPTKLSAVNDIILCIRATLGRPIFSNGEYCLGRGVAGIRPSHVNKYMLRYFFINNEQYLYEHATGSTFLQVTGKVLELMSVPLPPLPEQQRIVDRIESLFAKLDEAKEKAQAVVDGFEDRKAAILHKAFTGELTAGWRFENRIGKENWYSVPFAKIANAIDPQPSHRTPPVSGDGVPYIGIAECNYETGLIDFESARKVSKAVLKEHLSRYKLSIGNFIIGKIGTVGKPFRIPSEQSYTLSANIILIQPYTDKVSPDFLFYFFKSDFAERQFKEGIKATTQAAFGIKKVRNMIIALPPMSEQNEIVRILEAVNIKESVAKEAAEQVISQIDTMKKSILARAFRGELGTNDPADESAVELLKRIL